MNSFTSMILMILCTGKLFGEAPNASTPPSNIIEERLKSEFKYDPNFAHASVDLSRVTAEKPIELGRLVVTPYSQNRLLKVSIKQQEDRLKEKTFTNNEGGTFLETIGKKTTVEYKFKYNPHRNLMDIINISW